MPFLAYDLPKFMDGNWKVAKSCSLPVFSSPIPATTAEYIFTQDFIQLKNYWHPLALNTPHYDFDDFVLVSESPRTDKGGGVVQWTRTYAKAPDAWDDWEHYAYKFPGIWETSKAVIILPGTAVYGRLPITEVVQSRVHNEYFLTGTGQTYTDASKIPAISKFAPIVAGIDGQYVESVANNQSYFGLITLETDPSTTTYKSYVADAKANKWSATTGLLVAEDSRLSRWNGNIYQRQTRYVLAI